MKKPPQKRPEVHQATFRVHRRDFFKISGLGVGAALAPGLTGCAAEEVGPTLQRGSLGRTFIVSAHRPDDFLELRFEFIGLRVEPLTKSKLVKTGDGPFLIIVHFPSQHMLEGALYETDNYYPSVVGTVIGGPSRVVFNVPNTVTEIPYDIQSLLAAIRNFSLNVSDHALPANGNLPPIGGGPSLIITSQQAQGLSTKTKISLGQLSSNSGVSIGEVDNVEPTLNLNPGPPEDPAPTETAIELPYRMLISPNSHGGFTHASTPVNSGGRIELWHSRLGTFENGSLHERASFYRTIRALYARDRDFMSQDYDPNDLSSVPPSPLTPASLSPYQRLQIVEQMSNYTTSTPPRPADARQLMLTSLGGYLDTRAEWDPNRAILLWEHRAALGRDNFVKVVSNGYFYPSGHRAVLVQITERKLKRPGAPHTAYLYKRCFLVCKEPLKNYGSAGRRVPHEWMLIKTLSTPPLENCEDVEAVPRPFIPIVDGKPFEFFVEVLDRDGNVRSYPKRLMWVPAQDQTANAILQVGNYDAATMYLGIEEADLNGQRYAFGPKDEVDDTTYETRAIRYEAIPDGTGNQTPGYAPGLKEADVMVEAVRALGGDSNYVPVKYADKYVQHGFGGANEIGQVMLEAVNAVDLSFANNSKNSGGFIAPGMKITALSRKKGPIGGNPDNFASGNFSANDFFKDIDAMLFGVIPLQDIIAGTGLDSAPTFITQALDAVSSVVRDVKQIVDLATNFSLSLGSTLSTLVQNGPSAFIDVPNFLSSLLSDISNLASAVAALPLGGTLDGETRLIKRLVGDLNTMLADSTFQAAVSAFIAAEELAKNQTVRLEWRPPIDRDPFGFFDPQAPKQMLLSVEARGKDLPGKPAGVDLIAAIPNFNLNLLGDDATFMVLEFDKIQFRVVNGKKPEIDVIFKNIAFDGVLYFVQKLAEIIPLEGFSDPPNVEVNEEGLTAMFTLPLPNIAVGMFSLENIGISAGFNIPFFGPPLTVYFGFCSRESPFRLTVSMLGGGGFFGLTCSPKGMELLEASLEFGASLSVDFGVASGGISIMAGIYFAMGPDHAELTGYLRARGEVDVLGLISASIELYMELKYEFASHKVTGKASIEIEVSVFCFTGTVTVSAERKFAGSNEDPTFVELMEPQGNYYPFTEYLQAFAA